MERDRFEQRDESGAHCGRRKSKGLGDVKLQPRDLPRVDRRDAGLLAGLLLSAGPRTAAALLIAAPGCDWFAGNDIRCFDWPEELGACLDREQARDELNVIDGPCSDWIVVSVESDAKQRDGACCYEVSSIKISPHCPMAGGGGRGGPSVGSGGRLEGSGGLSAGSGGQSAGGGGQSAGGGGQSAAGGGAATGTSL